MPDFSACVNLQELHLYENQLTGKPNLMYKIENQKIPKIEILMCARQGFDFWDFLISDFEANYAD